jgi:hypothetical protein
MPPFQIGDHVIRRDGSPPILVVTAVERSAEVEGGEPFYRFVFSARPVDSASIRDNFPAGDFRIANPEDELG